MLSHPNFLWPSFPFKYDFPVSAINVNYIQIIVYITNFQGENTSVRATASVTCIKTLSE